MAAEQSLLFETAETRPSGRYAQVIFARRVEQAFTYSIPRALAEGVEAGKRVLAPFGRGNKPVVGYCIEVHRQKPDRAVKPLLQVIDDDPLLTPALLELTRWMARYYFCPFGRTLEAVVPAGAKSKAGTAIQQFIEAVPLTELPLPPERLTAKQTRALELLRGFNQPIPVAELAERAGVGTTVVKALLDKQYAVLSRQRVERFAPIASPPTDPERIELNSDQTRALGTIERAIAVGGFQAFLLHGVTGSGKTEIYLHAIDRVVRQGRQAIVLVPEISLTPQTIQRFRGRFPQVAVLHSHLTEPERGSYWRHIVASRVQVVVGARSAVFAPTPRLGLIVVDEEHEGSFKQESPSPRYHARDVAVMRASLEKVPIILGSATPSLESWHNAQTGKYTLLSLPQRVLDRPLPRVALIDLRHEPVSFGRLRAISPSLERAIREALDASGQVILLLNRRGFDTYLICPSCGHVSKCKFCDVSLTHHRQRDVVMCHYCGYEQPPPERCTECGLSQIRFLGLGTEKLEAEIAKKFPGVEARRMDSDSMRKPGSHAKVLDAFRRGEVRILFGTQMIAKGLDFPNVTLVGVVNADTALHLPDFRSAERTFQLLAQVAGRTGRGESGGKVLVQSFNPDHPCIALAARHDYIAFAESELKQRKTHAYPPYSRMARLLIRSKDQSQAAEAAELLAAAFRKAMRSEEREAKSEERSTLHASRSLPVRLLGPAEAPLFRLKGNFRYHFQLQSAGAAPIRELLTRVLGEYRPPEHVQLAVDVDPLNML